MVDSLFQGGQGMGGTHNAIMSSQDYLSTAQVGAPLASALRRRAAYILSRVPIANWGHLCRRASTPRLPASVRPPNPSAQLIQYAALCPAPLQRNFDNIEDGFYIAPAFLDKMSIHVAKVRAAAGRLLSGGRLGWPAAWIHGAAMLARPSRLHACA